MLLGARPAGTLQAAHGAGIVGGAAIAVVGLLLCAAAGARRPIWFGKLAGFCTRIAVLGVRRRLDGPPARLPQYRHLGLRRGPRRSGPELPWYLAQLARRICVVAASTALFVAPAAYVFRHADRWRREADKATSLTASRRLLHLCATAFCFSFGWEVPFVHLVSYAEDAGHAPSRAAGVVVAIGVGGSAGRILSARCADAVGAPRVFSALSSRRAPRTRATVGDTAPVPSACGAVAGTTAGGLIADDSDGRTCPRTRRVCRRLRLLRWPGGVAHGARRFDSNRVGSRWGGRSSLLGDRVALCLTLPRQPPVRRSII